MPLTETKTDPPVIACERTAEIDDRCEAAKILRAQPKTILFVFVGGRQPDDKEVFFA